jgi:hypothetical protein
MSAPFALDPQFQPQNLQIAFLLQSIDNGSLAIPDFQRDFVWDIKATQELLRSVMSRFPIGTLLFWAQGPETDGFAAREIEGAPKLPENIQPSTLILDGQQRLTALYRVLTGKGEHRWFVQPKLFIDETGKLRSATDVNFEDAIVSYYADQQGIHDQDYQFANAIFPLADLHSFETWLDRYARKTAADDSDEERIKAQFRAVREQFLRPLSTYGLPVVKLEASTPLEAVCNIFETLNSTGKPLGAFDLVTARLFPKGVKLRDLWDEAIDNYPSLKAFNVDQYSVLQALSLIAVDSAQRSNVLKDITAQHVRDHWQAVISAFADVIDEFAQYGVITRKYLPYGMLLVTSSAVWPKINNLRALEKGKARERLSQYFWCTTFMSNFDQGANSQAGADYIKLKQWVIDGSGTAPEAIKDFYLTESLIMAAGVRRKALHAGIMALTIEAGAKDFYNGQKITTSRISEGKIDSHHIFPRAYLNAPESELILNRALIDSETNKIIGKNPPSVYLEKMETVYEADRISNVFTSHAIEFDPGAGMRNNDYQSFLRQRLSAVTGMIESVTRLPVVKDLSGDGAGPRP